VWWMDPEARGGRDGFRLLQSAEAWARTQDAETVQMVAPDTHVEQFYRRLGYEWVESSWHRRLV
jgi:GNAT superfamily N-acetyltransferase